MPSRPTRKLFKEFNPDGKLSLEDWREVFIECSDPTEYEAALKLCGTWEEWERFKADWPYFNKVLLEWHVELDVKLRSSAIQKMIEKGNESAQRWVAEGKYKQKAMGRPSTEEKDRREKVDQALDKSADEEVSRVVDFIPNRES